MIKGKEHGIGELDEHFRNRIDVYADKHPTLLVRQLAERLRKEWNKIEEPEQEPVAWMYDWEEFDGDETEISYGRVTTDKNIFDCQCAMNITPLIKGVDDE